ncbi:IclR family transcriptional regulator [Kineococcus rhizosphaerae]|uniref:IclR family transcriptional regulator n=1 Tax=Kineococcus rhizosphaerae TaxID=559628 RepID=UPI001B806488|nr:IclR family transcriptional regulator [Kineococcus rhizosphaerae]
MAGSAEQRVSGYRERNSTAERALEILGLFDEDHPVISAARVAEQLGTSRSTAYRYVQSLVSSQFLEEAPGGGFRLGLRVLELARVARKAYGLSELALPVMQDLAAATHESVLLTRRVGDLVICLERAESVSHTVRISYERGSALPLNAGASALVLLAWADHQEVRSLLQHTTLRAFTDTTLTDVDALTDRLAHIRRDGFSVTRGEVDHDVLGVAAPIRDDTGTVVAALSVAALASRVPAAREADVVEAVVTSAGAISARLSAITG